MFIRFHLQATDVSQEKPHSSWGERLKYTFCIHLSVNYRLGKANPCAFLWLPGMEAITDHAVICHHRFFQVGDNSSLEQRADYITQCSVIIYHSMTDKCCCLAHKIGRKNGLLSAG